MFNEFSRVTNKQKPNKNWGFTCDYTTVVNTHGHTHKLRSQQALTPIVYITVILHTWLVCQKHKSQPKANNRTLIFAINKPFLQTENIIKKIRYDLQYTSVHALNLVKQLI